jgi:drug/metabolite transporter (DMT)-like permease
LDTSIFFAVLTAALLHAGWNSVIKVGLDRFSTVLLLALVQAIIAVPSLFFVPAPSIAAWSWIAVAALLHTGYKIFLIKAYEHADLSQAYPIARGTAPLLVFLFSLLFLHASFSWAETAAILAISGGILVMTFKGGSGQMMHRRGLLFSLGTAMFTASYTLVDGLGARVAGTASGFIMWMVIGDTIGMLIYAMKMRRGHWLTTMLPAWKTGLSAGAMSLGAYWITVWAFTKAPIALVASLRETSILFATVIAATLIKEQVTLWRWVSAACIALGVVLIRR